ncbi:MAG: hypothetical protein IPP30_00475 [Flavobacterium sp.]|nr:hypothetical protein [Flavobacterium sp.]
MKTTYKKISIYQHLDAAWSNRKNIFLLLVFLLILFSSINVSAQNQRVASSGESIITEKKSFLNNLRSVEQSTRAPYSNSQRLENLLTKVQHAVYYFSGTVKTYGDKPVCLFTDMQSLRNLNNPNIPKDNIELITIKVQSQSELNSSIDMNLFADFKNLKYLQIVSSVATTDAIISNMIRNNDEKYSVFFTIQKGDSE